SMKRTSSDSRYPSIYEFGYGKPDGIRGMNCRHDLSVFVPDVSELNVDPPAPADAREREEHTQKQRYYERSIRKKKRALAAAEATGNEQTVDKYKKQISAYQAKLREHIK